MSYIKIQISRIDDGSFYYHTLKNYEKFKTFIAVRAEISAGYLKFWSSGKSYLIELDKYDIKMEPII